MQVFKILLISECELSGIRDSDAEAYCLTATEMDK